MHYHHIAGLLAHRGRKDISGILKALANRPSSMVGEAGKKLRSFSFCPTIKCLNDDAIREWEAPYSGQPVTWPGKEVFLAKDVSNLMGTLGRGGRGVLWVGEGGGGGCDGPRIFPEI